MDRRKFIMNTGWLAFGVSASVLLSACKDDGGVIQNPGNSNNPEDEICNTTTKDILGPYYREGAPQRNSMRINGATGHNLKIEGIVKDAGCNSIENAKVEVWHASHEGEYDNDSSDFRYRAQVFTPVNGSYYFDTILPGKYLNGADYRPSHIHFRVTADGYKELVSQVYFENDSHIPSDPWASDPSAKLRILKMKQEKELITVNFDIILEKQ